ncbi:MAG: glycosyltransferase family 39 protein [Patescibacteria group bacterium]
MYLSSVARKAIRLLQSPLCILILGAVLLSVASFLAVPTGNDEGGWGYIGRAWANGELLPYSGIADNKTPGIFYLNSISYMLVGTNIWFPRFLALVALILTAVLMYVMVKHVANRRSALFSMTIFLLLMPLPAVDGAYAQTETFMNVFVMGAFFLLFAFKSTRNQKSAVFLSGLLLGFAIAFRQSAVVSLIPLLFSLSFLEQFDVKRTCRGILIFLIGVSVATGFSILPYLLSGGRFTDYIDSAWFFFLKGNVGVITGGFLHRISGFVTRFFIPELFPLATAAFLLAVYFRKIRDAGLSFASVLLVWVIFDFLSYNLEGTYFPHHLKLLAVSWAIAFGIVADFFLRHLFNEARVSTSDSPMMPAGEEEWEGKHGAILVALLIAFFVLFQNSYPAVIRVFLKGGTNDTFQTVGNLVKEITAPGDTIYVYGLHTGPIYFYASRNSPSKYFETQQLAMPGALTELKTKLTEKQPKVIVIPSGEQIPIWLSEFIAKDYTAGAAQFGYTLFEKTN